MSRAKSDFVDWASCLHPFGEDPYGPALPHDPVCAAIREARREDDPGLPQGVWERELKRADWDKALSLSLGVLRERSKDMQVAGWACEAALMRYGFASLPGGRSRRFAGVLILPSSRKPGRVFALNPWLRSAGIFATSAPFTARLCFAKIEL